MARREDFEEFGRDWMYPDEQKEETNMSECEKHNCGYYWQEEGESYPCCHYNDPIYPAPCEEYPEEDNYYDDCDDDCGYDPYMGCYTGDC